MAVFIISRFYQITFCELLNRQRVAGRVQAVGATRSYMNSCDDERTSPIVLPIRFYQSVRCWQRRGAKPLGQCESTASIKAVTSLELSGMVNESELLINVVMHSKPKMLRGLNQKVCSQVQRLNGFLTEMMRYRRKGRTSPALVFM